MNMKDKISVLFICMGNICRSPTAEGVFRHLLREADLEDRVITDSAGTHAYHVGSPPDERAQITAKQRGIELSDLRARRVEEEDFEEFDYVLAMDRDNYSILAGLCPADKKENLSLFLQFAPELNETEVPDPYYGGEKGFDRVFDLVEAASKGLLADIRKRHKIP